MGRIEELTKEQKALLSDYRDKWLAVGTCTEPANRADAEEGVRLAYKIAGKEAPRIVWCASPLAAGLTRGIVLNLHKVKMPAAESKIFRDSVRDSVGASVGDSVRASVRDSVGSSVWDSFGDSVWDSVWAYTGSFFRLPVWKYIKHPKGKYPYQPLVTLWNQGFVPSFDGTTWRLHAGPKAKIVYLIKAEDLKTKNYEGLLN